MFDPDTTIILYWPGHRRGIGEPLVLGWMVQTLIDNGIKALFQQHDRMAKLSPLGCPTVDYRWLPKKYKKYRWFYTYEDKASIHIQYLVHYSNLFEQPLKIYRNYIPVKYYEIPEVRQVDVVMNTQTGPYTPYKKWPYFKELCQMFDKHHITHIDLDRDWRETYGIKCLNYVRKAKVYLGLDTGMSHYVSRFANKKALILQGGFNYFHRWSWLYDYEPIQIEDMPCKPCTILKKDVKKGMGCQYKNRCMKDIDPKLVFEKVCERL